MDKIYLSLIIPTYNVGKGVRSWLEGLFVDLDVYRIPYEVIISDDGSNDDTISVVKEIRNNHPNLTLITNLHKGNVQGIKEAMMVAKGMFIFVLESKNVSYIKETPGILDAFNKGADVVTVLIENKHHTFIGNITNSIFGFLLLKNINYYHTTIQAYRGSCVKSLLTSLHLYNNNKIDYSQIAVRSFYLEILILCNKLNYKLLTLTYENKSILYSDKIRDRIGILFNLIKARVLNT